jgi:hypothetical protein
MAPSATSDIITPNARVEVAKQPEEHIHGAEDKTPLEAISHGPVVQPGTKSVLSQKEEEESLTVLGIPTFSSHAEHRRHILIHIAAVFRDFAQKCFTEGMRCALSSLSFPPSTLLTT